MKRGYDGRAAGDGDSNIDLAKVLPRLLCLLTSCIYYVLRNRDKLPPYSSSYSSLLAARLVRSPGPTSFYLVIYFSLLVLFTRYAFLASSRAVLLARTRHVVARDEHEKRRRPTTIIILCRDLFFVCSKIVKGSSPAGE